MSVSRRVLPGLLLPLAARAQPKPLVVASFSILGDLVAQVAGDPVTLRVLAGPETDAHDFQPRPSDALVLREATLVVRNGLGFEPWFDRLQRGAGGSARVVTASEGITPLLVQGVADPHAWQDVRLAQGYVRRIGAGLAAVPGLAARSEAGVAALLPRLAALDAEIRAALAAVPAERRVLVAGHAGLRYFAEAYGVRVLAPRGAQPAASEVAALIRAIREQRITALFATEAGNNGLLQRLAQETGTRVAGRLYTDTLSLPGGAAPSYEAMMRHNLRLMLAAMQPA